MLLEVARRALRVEEETVDALDVLDAYRRTLTPLRILSKEK